jgi:hypothetical protein
VFQRLVLFAHLVIEIGEFVFSIEPGKCSAVSGSDAVGFQIIAIGNAKPT